ncbi:ABC transporter ATP-binding protein [Curtobacterium flaccumfaciens]|nr:ABC transporter ATP-binding protein [Curtobacterium flaccumfaciens]
MSKSPTTARPSTFRAIARIYPYVKPYQGRLIGGMAAAMGASLVALAIPYVLQWLVDGPLSSRDSAQIWPAGLGVLALGVLEAFFIASRRRLVMRPSTRIETSMRNSLYAKLQDLPVAFHDRWESGQLLSRSVSDLSLIRRWLAFGVVLLVVNIVTIVVGFVVLFTFGWILGLIFLIASIPLWINGLLFERRYSAVARRSQDQVGDLATSVEQSVHGIRVLKAFRSRRREARGVQRAGRSPARHRDQEGEGHRRHLAVAAARAGRRVRAVPARRHLAGLAGAAQRRPAVRVLRDGDGAAVPDRVDRLPALDDVRHPHGGRPLLRGHGLREHHHGPGTPEDDPRAARCAVVQRRALPVPGLRTAVPGPDQRRRNCSCSRARPWRSSG